MKATTGKYIGATSTADTSLLQHEDDDDNDDFTPRPELKKAQGTTGASHKEAHFGNEFTGRTLRMTMEELGKEAKELPAKKEYEGYGIEKADAFREQRRAKNCR